MSDRKVNGFVDDMDGLEKILKEEGIAETVRIGSLPKTYKDNSATIRLLPARSGTLTNVFYQQTRPYQIVLYGAKVADVINRIDLAMRVFSHRPSIKAGDGYITINDGISFGEVLLDKDENTWFSIGVLETVSHQSREQEEYGYVEEVVVNDRTIE